MPFYSTQFVALLAVTYVAWLVVPAGSRWLVLLASSLYFVGVDHPLFLLPVLAAAVLTYFIAHRLARIPDVGRRKPLLALAIFLLVANLAFFKYAGAFGYGVLLPIGISFYTFQLIGYLVDVYRGFVPERDPRVFSLFVVLFPKMVSGPIERAGNLLPQLRVAQDFDYARTISGLQLILWGAFKKLVVADRLAPFVARVYDDPGAAEGPATVAATLLYAFQLYCDFSGYTDMAIGIAALFGYKLVRNFNRPYAATSIQDFWKRWHISLTSWLTDYVYNPLTRQKLLRIKFYYIVLGGLFVTFVVSGIWHGSHWNFVAWGALHGCYIVCSLLSQKYRNRFSDAIGLSALPRTRKILRIAVTFGLVCVAYVLFRAGSLSDAMALYSALPRGWNYPTYPLADFLLLDGGGFVIGCCGIFVVLAVEMLAASSAATKAFRQYAMLRFSTYFACAVAVIIAGAFGDGSVQFIYFQF